MGTIVATIVIVVLVVLAALAAYLGLILGGGIHRGEKKPPPRHRARIRDRSSH